MSDSLVHLPATDSAMLRRIPLEVLRAWYVDRVELSSLRAVAMGAGIGRSTLHKFVAGGTSPHPRVRRLLALYYVQQRNVVDVTEEREALGLLLARLPDGERETCAVDVLDLMERAHRAAGLEPPPWIAVLRLRQGGT